MKIIKIAFLSMLLTSIGYTQNYLISFEGAGDTTGLGTVNVENLTSGATVLINGDDVLHLIATTGFEKIKMVNGALQIFPNPMAGQSTLTFVTTETGDVAVSIIDLTGKIIEQTKTKVSSGKHSFLISGIHQGMYFLKVTGKSYNFTSKLISNNNLENKPQIAYVSSVANTIGYQSKSTAEIIDMPYTDGDILLFEGNAGQYGNVITDIPTGDKTVTFDFVLCKDSGGNTYSTVQIGTEKKVIQIWMAENLNVGVRIDGILNQTDNSIIEKYCSADLETNCDIYGGLYQWDEMMQYVTTPGAIGICPAGWHLPTEEEWCTVTQFLDPTVDCEIIGMIGTDIGGKMKETGTIHWNAPNTGATNISGFTVLPGGYRSSAGGTFGQFHLGADYWQSTEASATQASDRYFYYNNSKISRTLNPKTDGYSVRCLKD